MKQVALTGLLKKNADVNKIIGTAKIKIFMALVGTFQPLTNFTKNCNIGAMKVLNAPLEVYNAFLICAGEQTKYGRTVRISNYLEKLLYFLVHTEQEALVLFLPLCLLCKNILSK